MPPSRTRIDMHAVQQALLTLPRWRLDGGHLHRSLQFASFPAAFGFMAAVALEAEQLNHHPNWRNVYDRVEIELWTHDADGLTAVDLELATRIDRHAGGA